MMCQRCGQPEPIYKHGMCQDCYGYIGPERLEYARLLDVERNYKAGIAAAELLVKFYIPECDNYDRRNPAAFGKSQAAREILDALKEMGR